MADEIDRPPVQEVRVKTSRLTWVGVVALVLLLGMCVYGG